MFCHPPLDLLDRDQVAGFLLQDVLEQMLDDLLVNSLPLKEANDATRISAPSSRRTLVRIRLARNSKILSLSLICRIRAFLRRMARRVSIVRWLQLRGQAPFETRHQALFEIGDFGCGPVAREHDLFVTVEQAC